MEAESREGSLPSEAIRQLLEEAIDGALAKPKEERSPRLVIFIDDLDRCEPETAVRLLEGIKVYLNLGNCVTVLGMDQRQIERALARALQLGDPDDQRVGHHARESRAMQRASISPWIRAQPLALVGAQCGLLAEPGTRQAMVERRLQNLPREADVAGHDACYYTPRSTLNSLNSRAGSGV